MSDWTFGAVKARNMAVEAYCQNAACRRFYVFDLDYLIAEMGAIYSCRIFRKWTARPAAPRWKLSSPS